MAHLTNFSFEFFYEIFTEDVSLLLLYHGAKKSKMTKNSNQGGGGGPALNLLSRPGLEKSGRLVAICDQKIFLVTRSWAAVVNLATNFSTKGPVWRPQFCARFHVRTNGTVWRPEKEQQVSENEIQNVENFSRYSRNVNLAHSRKT